MSFSPQANIVNKGIITQISLDQFPNSLTILPSEVHIWSIRLSNVLSATPSFTDFVSTAELNRAHTFKYAHQRTTYLMHHSFVRMMLALYCHCPPKELIFSHNHYGKPYLSAGIPSTHKKPIFFNSSRSDDLLVLAISTDYEVGIDIEQLKDTFDFTSITSRYFSKKELHDLTLLNESGSTAMRNGFYLGWTSKEAFIKCIGLGLSFPLKDFTVNVDPRKGAQLVTIANSKYHVEDFYLEQLAIHTGFSTTVCLNKNINQLLV